MRKWLALIICVPLLALGLVYGVPSHGELKEAPASVLNIQDIVSPTGIKAWLVEDHSLPIISMKIGFRDGAVQDPEGLGGVSQLLSNTLDEGAGPYPSKEFQKRLNDSSISLNFDSGRDAFYANLVTLTKSKEEAFALLKLALTKPLFEEEAIERMREANMNRVRSSLSRPEWISARIVNDKIYAGHPYARNSGGTLTSLQSIKQDDLKAMVSQKLTKDNLVIAVSGAITPKELMMVLELVFGDLPQSSESNTLNDIEIQNTGKTFLYKMDIPQSFIEMNWDALKRDDKDFYAAQVMNQIFGASGFGSLLMEEIREKRGLTYGIYSSMQFLDHAPTLSISTSTEHKNVPEILALTQQVIEKMKSDKVDSKALADAKNYLIGSLPLQLTSTSDIAGILLSLQLDRLPKTYLDERAEKIRAVTAEDVRAVAQRLFAKAPATVLVGQPVLPEGLDVIEVQEIPDAE